MSESEQVNLRDYIEQILEEREKAVNLLVSRTEARHDALANRIEKCENFNSRMVGVGVAIALCAGAIGALMQHLLK